MPCGRVWGRDETCREDEGIRQRTISYAMTRWMSLGLGPPSLSPYRRSRGFKPFSTVNSSSSAIRAYFCKSHVRTSRVLCQQHVLAPPVHNLGSH